MADSEEYVLVEREYEDVGREVMDDDNESSVDIIPPMSKSGRPLSPSLENVEVDECITEIEYTMPAIPVDIDDCNIIESKPVEDVPVNQKPKEEKPKHLSIVWQADEPRLEEMLGVSYKR